MTGAPPDSPLRRVPRRYPRWLLSSAYALERGCARLLGGARGYARRSLRPPRLRLGASELTVPGLPAAFDGCRVVHLSDFHAGPFLDARGLDDVVALACAQQPDLVCFTGDYITHAADEGIALAATLGRIQAPAGAFAVFGNHDYRARREGEIAAAFAEHGIRTLRNQGVAVCRGADRLWLAGIEDVEEGKLVDLDAALAGRRPTDVTLLLAHHPDVADRIADRGIALVLAGHTHGGQIVIGGRSVFGFARRSRRLAGMHRVGDTAVCVTRGIGVLIVPLRLGAPAEVGLITLRRAP